MPIRLPATIGWSGREDDAQLPQGLHAVVEADFLDDEAVVPVNRIVLPDASGSDPMGRSSNAAPVCVPPPSHRPTT
jgi:hypothetical protein